MSEDHVEAVRRATWMIVSKPLREPFRDGSTVLVRTLVESLPQRFRLSYFGDPEHPLRPGRGDEVLSAEAMSLSPGLGDKARVLMRLAHPRRRRIPLHCFFTANRITSSVLAVLHRLSPGRPVVQDLTSSSGAVRFVSLLRALDAVVVHSTSARDAVAAAGLDPSRVVHITPGTASVQPVVEPQRHRRLLVAGDLDRPVVDRLLALGRALGSGALRGWSLSIAARCKSREDPSHRERLRQAFRGELADGRIELLGEVSDMDGLFRRSSLQLFLADHVRRKVDLPLVLLEGMARGIPLVTVESTPVTEILDRGLEQDLCPGRAVAPSELVEAVEYAAGQEDLLAQWGRQARELASREFSVERMVREYARLYDRLGMREP